MCNDINIKKLKPIIDVPTRWNSTFEMIKRATELKPVSFFIIYTIKNLLY